MLKAVHSNHGALFWNFWKPGNVGEFCESQEKAQSQGKVREFVYSGIFDCDTSSMLVTKLFNVQGHVLRTSYNLPVLYLYFNSFCICAEKGR